MATKWLQVLTSGKYLLSDDLCALSGIISLIRPILSPVLLIAGFVAAVLNCGTCAERASAANYVDLKIPGDGNQVSLAGVNRKGMVAGNRNSIGFLRKSDGAVENLYGPNGEDLSVNDMNDAGDVVATFYATYSHAFLVAGGKQHQIVKIDPPFSTWALASGINSRGDTTGISSLGNFIRTKDGSYTFFDGGSVCGINDFGVVAGTTFDNEQKGFLRTSDGTITVFDLPSPKPMILYRRCIDGQRNIVGTFYDDDNKSHAFIRKPDGSVIMLEAPGSILTWVQSIDQQGNAIGSLWTGRKTEAFIYKPDGSFRVFKSPYGGNIQADYSDGRGYIVGEYVLPDGTWHHYLRTH